MKALLLAFHLLLSPAGRAAADTCGSGVSTPQPIAVRTVVRVSVASSAVLFQTGIRIDSGSVYRFDATGTWSDGPIEDVGPAGYSPVHEKVPWHVTPILWLGAPFRRVRDANYFALIGEVGSEARRVRFVIGDSVVGWEAPLTGELLAFANDVRAKYGNNKGCVQLQVTRLQL